ncbi:hypothetical protein IFHNHDMJ_01100 [Synechococcus sp. CBW1107]|jgi:hypothetical protein|nr:hypothetical protein IFHNHDMJ_01100 [Synechococcus sp. CBW1107]
MGERMENGAETVLSGVVADLEDLISRMVLHFGSSLWTELCRVPTAALKLLNAIILRRQGDSRNFPVRF